LAIGTDVRRAPSLQRYLSPRGRMRTSGVRASRPFPGRTLGIRTSWTFPGGTLGIRTSWTFPGGTSSRVRTGGGSLSVGPIVRASTRRPFSIRAIARTSGCSRRASGVLTAGPGR